MKDEYEIAWESKAGKNLKKIYLYIKTKYSEHSAKKIRDEIIEKIEQLRLHPERYPPEPLLSHRKENFRYIVVRTYKVIYEFTGTEIRILLIFSTKQNPAKAIKKIK